MARHFSADLHLGHANIVTYCARPFADSVEMDRYLLETWNEAVGADDEVWVLGDLALGRIDESLALASRLQGTKVLVPGNHDRCWAGQAKLTRRQEWLARYAEAGFEVVEGPVSLTVGGEAVLAHHFPYSGDSQESDRFRDHRPADEGRWLLHGHVHTRWRQCGRMINVGVDAWAGRPVSESQLAELMHAGSGQEEPLGWQTPG